MKPMFALSLSFENIQLLHRGSGGWRLIGAVALDNKDFATDLAALRSTAHLLEPDGIECILFLPNDHIRYLTVPSTNHVDRDAAAREALQDATPYALDELAYDVVQGGDTLHIAAIARETLAEAEAFALEYKFNPIRFAAQPDKADFPSEPDFGPTAQTKSLLPPQSATAPDDGGEALGDTAKPETTDQFTSIRAAKISPVKSSPVAPTLSGASRDAEPPAPHRALGPSLDVAVSTGSSPDTINAPETAEHHSVAVEKEPADETQEIPNRSTPSGIPMAPDDPAYSEVFEETADKNLTGIQKPDGIAGKPKYLGLILTAVLLLFLAGVAAWASLFLEDGLAGLFEKETDKTEITQLPQETPPTVILEVEEMAKATVDPDFDEVIAPTEPPVLNLTDTDAAVLDALREPEPPQEVNLERTETRYAVSGIWQMAPEAPVAPAESDLENLYVASIGTATKTDDAIALPAVKSFLTDPVQAAIASPTTPGTLFDLDDRGLVIATVAGTMNPDGVVVYLGKPPTVPPKTPTRQQPNSPEQIAALDRLSRLRPSIRPDNLIELNDRSRMGGRTRTEMAKLRPLLRPKTAKILQEKDESPTKYAVKTSPKPAARPKDMDRIIQQANIRKTPSPAEAASGASLASIARVTPATPRTKTPAAPQTVTPKIPSSASVAKQATVKNAIKLNRVNLIGVYGKPSSRRALVRLSNGRYKKVQVGDRIDGGRVSAIGETELRYVKRGRSVVLKMPKG